MDKAVNVEMRDLISKNAKYVSFTRTAPEEQWKSQSIYLSKWGTFWKQLQLCTPYMYVHMYTCVRISMYGDHGTCGIEGNGAWPTWQVCKKRVPKPSTPHNTNKIMQKIRNIVIIIITQTMGTYLDDVSSTSPLILVLALFCSACQFAHRIVTQPHCSVPPSPIPPQVLAFH